MFIRAWRFITLLFVSLSMAMAFCHLLQLPPRMSYDAWLWRSTQSMYQHFGPPVGAIVESGAWITAAEHGLRGPIVGRGRLLKTPGIKPEPD